MRSPPPRVTKGRRSASVDPNPGTDHGDDVDRGDRSRNRSTDLGDGEGHAGSGSKALACLPVGRRSRMDSPQRSSLNYERLLSIVLLGLAGCAVTIVATSTPERTTVSAAGALFGVFLGFVAFAGVVDTIRGGV